MSALCHFSVPLSRTTQGEDPFWLEIGATFEHKDGKGLTVVLQAHPLDGRIVLREVGSGPREKPERRPEEPERREDAVRPPSRQAYKSGHCGDGRQQHNVARVKPLHCGSFAFNDRPFGFGAEDDIFNAFYDVHGAPFI